MSSPTSTRSNRDLRSAEALTRRVVSLEREMEALPDAELISKTTTYRQRTLQGEPVERLLPEAFAVVREASRRVLGQPHREVQLIGGFVLQQRRIAEMATGEGKTLVSALPAYVTALGGRGVHVVTANDYLAERDAEKMGRVHRFLGLSVGVVVDGRSRAERAAAYAADVTYATSTELGFDYLRDNMSTSRDDLVQRGHHLAIIDEVDSVLIDEARSPLIISGPATENGVDYDVLTRLVRGLHPDTDFEVDVRGRAAWLADSGIDKVQHALEIENLFDTAHAAVYRTIVNLLLASQLYRRDHDYIVTDRGEVEIVDANTGRVLAGRRYADGLHQAIEALEGVEVRAENQTLASVTLQNFFRLYDGLCGMTGTASAEAAEFHDVYSMDCVRVPPHRPSRRVDRPDLIFRSRDQKLDALVADVEERHQRGQPVLIGTTSVQESEEVARRLRDRAVTHRVLNAKSPATEAAVVADAGQRGAVTVATDMAGRGTDIALGGSPEFAAEEELRARGLDAQTDPRGFERAYTESLQRRREESEREHEQVLALGGLYVVGTERHHSRRVDDQLRGRSGRQGDPGETVFYTSMADELPQRYRADRLRDYLGRHHVAGSAPVTDRVVARLMDDAQNEAEEDARRERKETLDYDDVVHAQRTRVYAERRRMLVHPDLRWEIRTLIARSITRTVRAHLDENATSSGAMDAYVTVIAAASDLFPVQLTPSELRSRVRGSRNAGLIADELVADAVAQLTDLETRGGEEVAVLQRTIALDVIDNAWRDLLLAMDSVRGAIHLRALARGEPLQEYRSEGNTLFNQMRTGVEISVSRAMLRASGQGRHAGDAA